MFSSHRSHAAVPAAVLVLTAFFALMVCTLPAAADEVDDDASVEAVVREVFGLKHVTFGGRLFCDWMEWGSVDSSLETAFGEDEFVGGTEFRTARVQMAGEVSDRIGFFVDYDFSGGEAKLKDAYMEYRRIEHLGNIRIGHIREPFGLEGLTSSKYTTFMEPALTSAFYPWRNTGLMLHNTVADDVVTWQAGIFRDADATGAGRGEDEFSYTARLASEAWRSEDGRRIVHLGASYSHRNPGDEIARFKSASENHLGPVLADTGELQAHGVSLLGFEIAAGFGPVLLQGEYVKASVDQVEGTPWLGDPVRGGSSADFSGYYVQVSWLMTGETHPFSKGAPGRIKPRSPLGDGGRGAFELAVRYSGLDLTDTSAHIEFGELSNTTVGLNWYTSANSRIMLNYVISDYMGPDAEERGEDIEGSTSALLTRFQIDF